MIQKRFPSASALFVFEAAARTKNFSRAAVELGITQPAVSRSISALEAHLGHQLFARSGPHISLTACGESLSRVTTNAFRLIDEVITEWDRRDPNRDTVLLSISSAMATHWLIPRLGDFRTAFPDVDLRFELIPGGVGETLAKCDLGLRVVEGSAKTSLDGFYMQERIQPLASPSYLREHGSFENPHPGKKHTLIALSDHWCTWSEFASRTGSGVPNHELLSFADYSVVLQTAISGQGIALGWISVTSKLLLDNVLQAASNTFLDTGKSYHLLGPSVRPMRPITAKVREWMIEQMWRDVTELGTRFEEPVGAGAKLALPTRTGPNAGVK